ncbi:MAG: putative transport system ATP-binding protein [Actinomycetota bacterium]|nr:putative transport system ATP-binding protein [Actinomycetota bacterium]
MNTPALELRGITKVYGQGETAVQAVAGVDLVVEHGEHVAVMGASGSGKSTLMHVLGCLDTPTSGTYRLGGLDTGALDDRRLALLRNRRIGFVFQSFNLIPRTTALANVELPLAYAGVRGKVRKERAQAALDRVGLANRVDHLPSQLSGGQQQRVAIARAIVTEPLLLLADEPTGALDSHSTEEVLQLFDQLNAEGRTIVVITHEEEVAARSGRVLRMFDGKVYQDERRVGRARTPAHRSQRDVGEVVR